MSSLCAIKWTTTIVIYVSHNAYLYRILSANLDLLEPLRASRYDLLSTGLSTDPETRDLTNI
jgi:hypothetical protein